MCCGQFQSHAATSISTARSTVARLRRFPDVRVACLFVDRIVNLVDEGVEVAVRIGALPDSSANAIPVGSVRSVICASRAYLRKNGAPEHPADLARHTIVAANTQSVTPEWRFAIEGTTQSVRVNPRLTMTSNAAAISAALAGFGWTRTLSYQVASALRSGRLVRVLERFEPPPLPIHIVHREGRHGSQKARAFIDLAVAAPRANPAVN
jgi:DNA-binding transcriptional LysR family regulator